MAQSDLSKGQRFSNQGNPVNPVKPRTLRPNDAKDQDEAVQVDWINQPGDAKELLGPRQTDATTFSDTRKVGTGDKPFDWPIDDTKNSTDVLLDTNTSYEWGREAPRISRTAWTSYAANPGRTGPIDPTAPNPKRPDFAAPSNDAYDVSGMGEGEVNTGGERGIFPVPGKKNQWA